MRNMSVEQRMLVKKELPRKKLVPERIGDWEDKLRDFLKQTPIEFKPTVTPLMPKRVSWDDVRKFGLFMNVWDLEPLLLDTLEYEKENGDEERITLLRGLIRTASWATHRPVNPEVAKKDAEAFFAEAQEREQRTKKNPFSKQTGFGFDEEAETQDWQHVIAEVGSMDCKGERVETATQFVERVFVKEWQTFLSLYQEKGKKRTWPDRGIDVKLEPEVKAATERITKMRNVRDQLYYQRLYPNLCEFGHEGMTNK